jgi:antibiotic biosynthesis monooxygenase (ABM) superfamily enzyme
MKTKARLLMSLKIWLVIYPSITLFLFLFGQQLSPLPLYQRTFILTVSLVPWMMFVGVPFLDLLIQKAYGKKSVKQAVK